MLACFECAHGLSSSRPRVHHRLVRFAYAALGAGYVGCVVYRRCQRRDRCAPSLRRNRLLDPRALAFVSSEFELRDVIRRVIFRRRWHPHHVQHDRCGSRLRGRQRCDFQGTGRLGVGRCVDPLHRVAVFHPSALHGFVLAPTLSRSAASRFADRFCSDVDGGLHAGCRFVGVAPFAICCVAESLVAAGLRKKLFPHSAVRGDRALKGLVVERAPRQLSPGRLWRLHEWHPCDDLRQRLREGPD